MRRFKWIEWNVQKIEAHGLSPTEVEASFDRVLSLRERRDGSFEMYAATGAGRRIWVIRSKTRANPIRIWRPSLSPKSCSINV